MFPHSLSVRKNLKSILRNALFIFVACYFVFHIFSGARGAVSWSRLSREIASLEKELKNLRAENEFLENKINLIRSDNLDPDLLEEQAHSILGFSNENDIIVLFPKK